MKNVTSIDVARKAGVSQSSVSRAFSKPPTESGVSEAMQQRIFKAAEELGFRPNAMTLTSITRRSRIIALLFSYLDNPFYALALEKLCLALQKKGYRALVFMIPDTLSKVEEIVEEMIEHRVDGIATASIEISSDLIENCRRQDIPVVMFNRVQDVKNVAAVSTDNIGGARQIARYLIAGGHKRIAMLGGWEGASTNRDREFGFRTELDAQGVRLHGYARGDFDLTSAAQATRSLFDVSQEERPDAVFVTNDYMAFQSMSVLRHDLGLSVPGDVSIIGFDDVPRASAPEYALTTFRQPLNRMIEQTVDSLIRSIETRDDEPSRVTLPGRLVERASARRPR